MVQTWNDEESAMSKNELIANAVHLNHAVSAAAQVKSRSILRERHIRPCSPEVSVANLGII